MYSVGVAIRLGYRPSEVLRWSMLDVALVAAYCELEHEDWEKKTPPQVGAAKHDPRGERVQTVRHQVKYVVKKKEQR